MYKKISYILFVLIIGSIAMFIFLNNKKLERKNSQNNTPKTTLTEEERVNIIFKNELTKEKPE